MLGQSMNRCVPAELGLANRLRGDLDAIVARATAPSPDEAGQLLRIEDQDAGVVKPGRGLRPSVLTRAAADFSLAGGAGKTRSTPLPLFQVR